MRVLVLGGTLFLSAQIARDAVARGHEVTCVARGRSGQVPEGVRLLCVDREHHGALEVLADDQFDAVIDVARAASRWVVDALDVLADRAQHWTFVSSISAYADSATVGQTIEAPLREPIWEPANDLTELTAERYGSIKVASEKSVRERVGEQRSFVVRPGLITGPADPSDRFGYWAARFARGGRAIIPDTPHQPIQHIDVRDLAAWIITAAETGLTGTYDAVGPITDLGSLLQETAQLVGTTDLEPIPIAPETLTESGVTPWAGPKSLPLWLPTEEHGLVTHDPAPALAAGLTPRPLADTVHATLADERRRGLGRPRKAGLTATEEQQLLDRGF
ncbi:NAD-dependent epimerase/dehydratase family protein [Nocardia sp. NPDC058658]|uniref:NAD-dependent epimerase/dehydratase family protein n=1 Tax=Nocardia sp. NPDC058658 TaxID=3346580 RepID=UPI00365444D5